MKLKRAISCLVLLNIISLISSPLCSSQALETKLDKPDEETVDNSDTSKHKIRTIKEFYAGKLLKGTIETTDLLPKVPNNLMPGNRYPNDPTAGMEGTETWVRTPAWLAGKWKSELWLKNDGPFYFSTASLAEGHERDAEGQIWSWEAFPYDASNGSLKRVCDYGDQPQVSAQLVKSRLHYIASSIDAKGIITRTWQEEYVFDYSPNAGGTLNCVSSVKLFDLNGQKFEEYTGKWHFHLVEPFIPSTDKSVQNSFKNYLIANGLEQLIPANLIDSKSMHP